MFGELFQILGQWAEFLWPFRKVEEYERGTYYVLGKAKFKCRPGVLYVVVPWFCDVKTTTSVRRTVTTPLQTITCQDGGTLTFSASAQIEVADVLKAYNTVQEYEETATEDIAAILAEKLSEVEAERLDPARRGRLAGACLLSLQAQLGEYGVGVRTLRFNNFVRNIRVFRLFNDQLYNHK